MSDADPLDDGQVLKELCNLVERSFDLGDLKQLVHYRFGKKLESLVDPHARLPQVIFDLVQECRKREWQCALVAAVWLERRAKREVADFVSAHWADLMDVKTAEGLLENYQQAQKRPPQRAPENTAAPVFMRSFPDGLLESAAEEIFPIMGMTSTIGELVDQGVLTRSPGEPVIIHATRFDGRPASPKESNALLSVLIDFTTRDDFFGGMEDGLGRGQALLLRDLVSLAEKSKPDAARDRVRNLAYAFLKSTSAARYRLIAIDVRETMIRLDDNPDLYAEQAADWLDVGEAKRAMQLLDPFVDSIDISTSTELERDVNMLLNWARACKDAGEGRARNRDVLKAYDRAIKGIEALLASDPDDREYLRAKAAARHNKAAHLAVFGSDGEVTERDVTDARALFTEAQDLFEKLGDVDGRIEVLCGSAADLIDRDTTGRELGALLESFDRVYDAATALPSASTRFEYWYQRARLLKRLHPKDPERAAQAYEEALKCAAANGRRDRVLIAERWTKTLRPLTDPAQQAAELDSIANELMRFAGAWPSRVAAIILCDLIELDGSRAFSPWRAEALTKLMQLAIRINDPDFAQRALQIAKKHAPSELLTELRERFGARLRRILRLKDGEKF